MGPLPFCHLVHMCVCVCWYMRVYLSCAYHCNVYTFELHCLLMLGSHVCTVCVCICVSGRSRSVALLHFLWSAAGLTAPTFPFFPSILPIMAASVSQRYGLSAAIPSRGNPRPTSQHTLRTFISPYPPSKSLSLSPFSPFLFTVSSSLVIQGIALFYSSLIYHCLPSQQESGNSGRDPE